MVRLISVPCSTTSFQNNSYIIYQTDEFQLDKAMGTTAGAAMIYQLMWAIGLIMGKLI